MMSNEPSDTLHPCPSLWLAIRRAGGKSSLRRAAPLVLVVCALVCLGASQARQPASRPATDRAPTERFEERYAGLMTNNLFKRDRRPPRAMGTTIRSAEPEAAPPPPPQRDWMLTGIIFEDGRFRAYLEHLSTGESQRVDSGHAVAGGAVTEVFIDALGYELDGHVRWIELGQDLTGAFPEGITAPPPTINGGATTPPAPADGRTLSIEERLRKRRAAETRRP